MKPLVKLFVSYLFICCLSLCVPCKQGPVPLCGVVWQLPGVIHDPGCSPGISLGRQTFEWILNWMTDCMLAQGRDKNQTVETVCLCVKCFHFKEFAVTDTMKYQMWLVQLNWWCVCVSSSHALKCVSFSIVEHFQTYILVVKRLPGWVIQLQRVGERKIASSLQHLSLYSVHNYAAFLCVWGVAARRWTCHGFRLWKMK